jgi:PST family polysaccharide transporter
VKTQKLIHNIAALSVQQFSLYLLPLITLPYVTRVLGVEAWGKVALAQVVLSYFVLMTNWGFNISGTRKVAALRSEHDAISRSFCSIWAAQWLLLACSLSALLSAVYFIPFFSESAEYYFWGAGLLVGAVMFPSWFLSGMEKIKDVVALQVASRFAGIPFVFLLVRSPQDAPVIIAINASTGVLGGVLALFWIRNKMALRLEWPSLRSVLAEIKEGGSIFLSTVAVTSYTTMTPVVLGAFAGNAAVGYYSLADRMRQLAQSALAPISQALFPRMSYLFGTDQRSARALLSRSSKISISISLIASILLVLFAEPVVLTLAGSQFLPAAVVLKILSPLPFVVTISNILGMQIMLPTQKVRAFNAILFMAGIGSIMMVVPLITWREAQGAALNTLITECFVAVSMAVYLNRVGFFRTQQGGDK